MKLHRVAEHLKHQHWTTIGIDLVIVVIGVFIGMQASNWNAERETNQQPQYSVSGSRPTFE